MSWWLLNLIFNIILPTLVLIIGNIGNTFIILIFVRKNLRKYSSSIYFIAIAVADTLALNIECLQFYVPTIVSFLSSNKSQFHEYWSDNFKLDVQIRTHYKINFVSVFKHNVTRTFHLTPSVVTNAIHLNDVLCKLQSISFYTAYEISSWLLVLLSIDRCLSVTFPMNKICKPKVAIKLVAVCVVTILMINLHGLLYVQLIEKEFFNTTITESNTRARGKLHSMIKYSNVNTSTTIKLIYGYKCGVDEKRHPIYGRFYNNHWNTFDFVFSVFIPSILLAIFNAKIIYTMRKSLRKLKRDYEVLRIYSHSVLSKKLGNIYCKKIMKLKQMNLMLISAVVTFFLFYAPYSIYYMIVYNTQTSNGSFFGFDEGRDVVGQLLLVWSLLNVAFDFYIFYFTGSNLFRSEFKRIKKSLRKTMCRKFTFK